MPLGAPVAAAWRKARRAPVGTATRITRELLRRERLSDEEIDGGLARWCKHASGRYLELLADADTSDWRAPEGTAETLAQIEHRALLTGNPEDQGRGTPGDEIRDGGGRVPNLWFGDREKGEAPRQLFHVEVYVAPEVADERIAAVMAAGGTVLESDDGLTVIADQEGNRGVLCVDVSAVAAD